MNNTSTIKKATFGTPEQRGNVTIYPALPAEILRTTRGRKIRTAAYTRVSTDSTQQESSLILQTKSRKFIFARDNLKVGFLYLKS